MADYKATINSYTTTEWSEPTSGATHYSRTIGCGHPLLTLLITRISGSWGTQNGSQRDFSSFLEFLHKSDLNLDSLSLGIFNVIPFRIRNLQALLYIRTIQQGLPHSTSWLSSRFTKSRRPPGTQRSIYKALNFGEIAKLFDAYNSGKGGIRHLARRRCV